ncbi:ubiquitin-activating enzyme E1 3 [Viridothelium virens]|uniref:Ubiquitin-activating enzyme E1-like n=1 Tax=Viridothelium virens TaxID=1048519 RepID=A0A6A6HLJ7_VIRVR|nr:ubiquitin-activating enzyme E1 3 [Viridothelium virens]
MAATLGRDRYARQSLGSLHARVKESRVLMVGAGGIGCELLKNLVLTGFGEIHVVDLDTIDLSNLNRQFLFRHEHIKKSKALVAAESATKFNPNVQIHPHHANIRDPQFSLNWFKSFAIVFNALDNLDARRYVNRMCLAADVPLIESGTTGFNGQCQTECYDCTVKETPKTFPVCTIRSTPSQPIHCIVWAKSYLFTEIFGTSEDDAPELDHSEDADNAEEIAKLREESQALKRLRKSMGSEDFPRLVFKKVFKEDIERLRSMEDMWKARGPPEALDLDTITQQSLGTGPAIAQQDQVAWTLAENYAVFSDSMRRLGNRLEEARANADLGNAQPILTFDKDDEDTLDFVAAAANLRSTIFGIESRSKFDIKQMAGNIIPAIATTNAMTAGLCVLQAFKVLRGDLQKARMVFLTKSTERIISSETLRLPQPDCAVCGVAQASIQVDTSKATLNDLVEGALREQLGYGEEFSVSSDAGVLYDPELEDNLGKTFKDLGVAEGQFLVIVDDALENPRVNLVLAILAKELSDDAKAIILPEKIEIPLRPPTDLPTTINGANGEAVVGVAGKRKREADEADLEEEQTKKRGKVVEEPAAGLDDLVLVDDSATNGAILIDD